MSNKTVKVIAVQTGFYLGLRAEGDVFEVPESLLSKDAWFKRHEVEQKVVPPAASVPTGTGESDQGGKPLAYSRMNKGDLTLEAAKLGIELTGEETIPQIVELLTAKQSQE